MCVFLFSSSQSKTFWGFLLVCKKNKNEMSLHFHLFFASLNRHILFPTIHSNFISPQALVYIKISWRTHLTCSFLDPGSKTDSGSLVWCGNLRRGVLNKCLAHDSEGDVVLYSQWVLSLPLSFLCYSTLFHERFEVVVDSLAQGSI